VDALLHHLKVNGGELFAPARQWPEARVRRAHLDYFAAHGALPEASVELRKIARRSLKDAAIGATLLGRAWIKHIRGKFRSKAKPA